MLESYEHEIIRKRRSARFFWFLVFSFAIFLYFFFQGYYPAFDITWKQVFSSGGVREITRDEFIRSFGIINIRVYPQDANITVNGISFGYDEKKMVPYGKYRLSVGKPGFIQDRVRFSIDRKMPYFISEIHLIPQASYIKIGTGAIEVTKVNTEKWIFKMEKTHFLYDRYFATGSRIPPGGDWIGEGNFLSGTSIYSFGTSDWEKKSWSGSSLLIRTCDEKPKIQKNILWCPTSGDALSPDGFLYKGIISIHDTYLLGENSLFTDKKEFPLNKQENTSQLFLKNKNTWYTPNAGLLVPLVSNIEKTSVPLIETSLDSVLGLKYFEGTIIAFGKKGPDSFVVFLKNNEKIRVPFPDISLEGLEVTKVDGVFYFKTNNALLFLYEGSEKIEWITEGEILAYSSVSVLYRKDGEIWRANWGRDEK